jgi:hypothetical protein
MHKPLLAHLGHDNASACATSRGGPNQRDWTRSERTQSRSPQQLLLGGQWPLVAATPPVHPGTQIRGYPAAGGRAKPELRQRLLDASSSQKWLPRLVPSERVAGSRARRGRAAAAAARRHYEHTDRVPVRLSINPNSNARGNIPRVHKRRGAELGPALTRRPLRLTSPARAQAAQPPTRSQPWRKAVAWARCP